MTTAEKVRNSIYEIKPKRLQTREQRLVLLTRLGVFFVALAINVFLWACTGPQLNHHSAWGPNWWPLIVEGGTTVTLFVVIWTGHLIKDWVDRGEPGPPNQNKRRGQPTL